jgi:hypothetical protein
MAIALRWITAILSQLILSFCLGLLLPFQVSEWTGWQTLWMLPLGLVFGTWAGGYPIWPRQRHERWICLLSCMVACVLLIGALLLGLLGEQAPFAWIPLFPLLGFNGAAAWYLFKHRRSAH